MKYILIIASVFLLGTKAQTQIKPISKGWHSFTIQWITFNKSTPGKVYIKEIGEEEYSIEGEQRDPKSKEYVTIKGTFLNRGNILKFNGKIVSKINSINGGQPCELTGLSIFKASGKRKYWRLQQMLNCDGETTDYIDIYF
ncbi:hypothetical protein GJU39_17270 [Pedobacter petrophilus]|uniref:DUF2147 domain-containing protein n=1 Tax=Pedobacter petrophilus TaxID=1908241 RepID=A0A7K0G4D9_9SPHI|nr:hypothetical protein [Pedobacter petrophilus]MRX77836.1 hypothetical protein [Pedobacter petrophilus]